jgi:hypothetical protein
MDRIVLRSPRSSASNLGLPLPGSQPTTHIVSMKNWQLRRFEKRSILPFDSCKTLLLKPLFQRSCSKADMAASALPPEAAIATPHPVVRNSSLTSEPFNWIAFSSVTL